MSVGGTIRTCVAAAGTYCGLGLEVPIIPTLVSVVAVIIVRILVWTRTKSIGWNIAVMSLCAMAAFVTVEGSDMNTFKAFWTGVGYGGIGVGLIEIAKSAMMSTIAERFGKAMNVFMGNK